MYIHMINTLSIINMELNNFWEGTTYKLTFSIEVILHVVEKRKEAGPKKQRFVLLCRFVLTHLKSSTSIRKYCIHIISL